MLCPENFKAPCAEASRLSRASQQRHHQVPAKRVKVARRVWEGVGRAAEARDGHCRDGRRIADGNYEPGSLRFWPQVPVALCTHRRTGQTALRKLSPDPQT